MGRSLKRSREAHEVSEEEENTDLENEWPTAEDEFGDYDENMNEEEDEEDEEITNEYTDEEEIEDEEEDDDHDEVAVEQVDDLKNAEMEELEKEYMDLRHQEQDLVKHLKRHKDEDLSKGQAVKNQKALWDKTLEFRFLLQKPFSSSNKLPQEPVRSLFCDLDEKIGEAYSDLIDSSKRTLDAILELQEALLEKNPSITQSADDKNAKNINAEENHYVEEDGEWMQISQMHSRMGSFRDKSVDKWQRKSQLTTGAAAIKGKFHAFNQNISEQVAAYMRDPSKMIKGMQQVRLALATFGSIADPARSITEEVAKADGDPELLDDTEFYQQLLREFFETYDPTSSETAYYNLKRMQTKKRKIVDRRASKSRKIRYHDHEKAVSFLVQKPDIQLTTPKFFGNLFGH